MSPVNRSCTMNESHGLTPGFHNMLRSPQPSLRHNVHLVHCISTNLLV
jgi:hypothetical protein